MEKKHIFNINKKVKVITAGIIILALACTVTFHAGVAVGAADSEPGSIGDPLVSKSYLDSRLDSLDGVMSKVTVSKGSTLTVSEGAMVIIYSGNGTVITSGAGLINVTAGELTASGLSVAKYNTYLFPDAATGIKATSNMVVFVTGTYKVSQ